MKKKNNIYIYGLVLIALIVVSYFVLRDTSGEKKTLKIAEKIFTVDSAAVDKFEIERGGKKITMERKGGTWNVTSPVVYTANLQFIGGTLSNLKNYKISSIVSENPENKNKFGFSDTNVTRVSIYQNGALAGVIMVGNASTGAGQTYIKKSEGNEIYLAEDFLFNNFVKFDLTEWRDKSIMSIPRGGIKSIDFYTDKEKYTVIQDTSNLFYVGKDSVSSQVFDGVLNMLQNFSTQNFKDTTILADAKPMYGAKVTAVKETEIKFIKYGTEDSKKFLLQVTGISQIFEVDENFVKQFVRTKSEVLGKKQ
ncbi:MAG: DUF4340 domain-containing protein [Ignavibacteriota bacterium]